MQLSLVCSCELELQLFGGNTRSCFPKAEALLDSTEYQKCLEIISSRKDVDKYRSVMDFLASELFPSVKVDCFKYYDEEGPRAVDLYSKSRLESIDKDLCLALEIAYQARKQNVSLAGKWNTYLDYVEYSMMERSLAA